MTEKKKMVNDSNRDFIRRNFVPKNVTEDEFILFESLANEYDLNPMLKQIYCIKYGSSPAMVFAGRDGFRDIAHRSGKFGGCHPNYEKDAQGNVISATCEVWRTDGVESFKSIALMKEYNTHKSLWAAKPVTMLMKVAESQALRMAFRISGLYDSAEFDLDELKKAASEAPQVSQKPVVKDSKKPQQPKDRKADYKVFEKNVLENLSIVLSDDEAAALLNPDLTDEQYEQAKKTLVHNLITKQKEEGRFQ